MAVDLINLDALGQAARMGSISWFHKHREALGFAVSADVLRQLLPLIDSPPGRGFQWGRPAMTIALTFSVMLEAAQGEAGVAVAEARRPYGGKDVVVAYRSDNHQLYVTTAYAPNTPMRMGDLWQELSPWYKNLARNRKRLATWCADPEAHNIVVLPLVARAPEAPTSNAGEGLLAAVIAHPDDVGARLVYADWLVEQGDAQGQLIQVSEALVAMDRDDPRRKALEDEAARLASHFGERIAGEAGRLAKRHTLVRGFVDQVEMSASRFATHFERLSRQHPIRQLTLTPENTEAFARLARAPALKLLRSLALRRTPSPPPLSLTPLFASPHLQALEQLDITFWDVGTDAFSAFSSLAAPAFRDLSMHLVRPLTDVMAGLAANPHIHLRHLNIWGDEDVDGGAFLAPTFATLQWMQLSTPVGDDAARALAQAMRAMPDLWYLDIYSQPLTNDGALAILQTAAQTSLRALDLDGPLLDGVMLREVALALPDAIPLKGLSLPRPKRNAPSLVKRFEQRFSPAYGVPPPKSG